MAVSSVVAKGTPEAQLRAYIEIFDSKHQRLIRAVRSAVRKRLPTDRPTDAIVSFAARTDGVRLYLMHGPQLPDPKKLLLGSGKQVRFIRVEAARRLAHPDVETLIAAAIDQAGVPLPTEGRGRLVIRSASVRRRPRRSLPK